MKIEYLGRLPGLNEIITESKKGRGKYQPYAIMKEQYTSEIGWLAKKMPSYQKVNVTITWIEPNRRRDPDNIQAGAKFVMDGLVAGGVIKDDSQRYVKSIRHFFEVDKENPRIEIDVEEVG